jgi:hypothetical protein
MRAPEDVPTDIGATHMCTRAAYLDALLLLLLATYLPMSVIDLVIARLRIDAGMLTVVCAS